MIVLGDGIEVASHSLAHNSIGNLFACRCFLILAL
jgi:hypothetical protein